MRRTLSLLLATCLTLGGAAAVVYLLFFAAGWKGWMVIAAAFVAGVGAMWLWSDVMPDEKSQ